MGVYRTDDQKTTLRAAMIDFGLNFCSGAYTGAYGGAGYSWWTTTNGNWNCVCNSGCTMGALAILGDDTTGTAESVLNYTITNAKANCANAVHEDGTWSETPNYWSVYG